MLNFFRKIFTPPSVPNVDHANEPLSPSDILESELAVHSYSAGKQLTAVPWGIEIPKSEWYLDRLASLHKINVSDLKESKFVFEHNSENSRSFIKLIAPNEDIIEYEYPLSDELLEKMELLRRTYPPEIIARLITRIVDQETTILISPEPVSIDVLALTTIADMQEKNIAPKSVSLYRDPYSTSFRFVQPNSEDLHIISPKIFHSTYETVPGGEFCLSLLRQKMSFFKSVFDNIENIKIAKIRGLVIDYESYLYFSNLCDQLDVRYTEFIKSHEENIPTLQELEDFNLERFEANLSMVIESDVTTQLYCLGEALEKGKYVDLHDQKFSPEDIWRDILNSHNEFPGASCLRKHKDKVLYIPGFDEKAEFEVTVPKALRDNPQINNDIKTLIGDSRDMRLASLYCSELTLLMENLEKENVKYGRSEKLTLNDFYVHIIQKASMEVLNGIKGSVEQSNTRKYNQTNIELPNDAELLDFINFAFLELANNSNSYSEAISNKFHEMFKDRTNFTLSSVIENYSFKRYVVADRFNKYDVRALGSYFNYGQEHLNGIYFRNPLLLLAIRRLGNKAYVYHRAKGISIDKDFKLKKNVLVCESCSTMHSSSHNGSCIACGSPGLEAKTLVFEEEKVS